MSEFKEIVLFGYSGHSYVVIESCLKKGYLVKAYFDQQENKSNLYNLIYLGREDDTNLDELLKKYIPFPSIGNNHIRKKMINLFVKYNALQINIIDPTAIISSTSTISLSTFISSNVIVNAFVKIGQGCILNTSSIIEHESVVGNFSHIAPGVVLCGNVCVGELTFIGANTVVKQGIKIGSNVIVGAGSVVLTDIPDNQVWVGNPAKRIK